MCAVDLITTVWSDMKASSPVPHIGQPVRSNSLLTTVATSHQSMNLINVKLRQSVTCRRSKRCHVCHNILHKLHTARRSIEFVITLHHLADVNSDINWPTWDCRWLRLQSKTSHSICVISEIHQLILTVSGNATATVDSQQQHTWQERCQVCEAYPAIYITSQPMWQLGAIVPASSAHLVQQNIIKIITRSDFSITAANHCSAVATQYHSQLSKKTNINSAKNHHVIIFMCLWYCCDVVAC